jgi:hypothetical protein
VVPSRTPRQASDDGCDNARPAAAGGGYEFGIDAKKSELSVNAGNDVYIRAVFPNRSDPLQEATDLKKRWSHKGEEFTRQEHFTRGQSMKAIAVLLFL